MMNNKNIPLVFLSLSNNMGGAEQILHLLAKKTLSPIIYLKKSELNILPILGDSQFISEKSLVYGFLGLFRALNQYKNNHIIFSSHAYLNGFLGILKRLNLIKSKVVVRESTSLFTRYTGLKRMSYKYIYKLGYPCLDLVICQTQEMREQLLTFNPFLEPDKVKVFRNPIDLDYLVKRSSNSLDNELGDYICTAGRLIPIKGFTILIRAFKHILIDYPNLKLIILGDGPQKSELFELINLLGLDKKVILLGYKGNPMPYFRNAKLNIISSIKEGFPNTLLQMMAVNSNVVSTLCAGGINEIKGVITCNVNNEDELLESIKSALSLPSKQIELNEVLYKEYLVENEVDHFVTQLRDSLMISRH